MPTREGLLASRWLRPFGSRIADPALWRLHRRPVRRGLAIGLFSGFIVPLAQTPLAVLIAIPLRANLLVAATATLITNPLTFPIIYYLAYRLGHATVSAVGAGAGNHEMGGATQGVVPALATGLALLAVMGAVMGWVGCEMWWRWRTKRRWRRRRDAAAWHRPHPIGVDPAGS